MSRTLPTRRMREHAIVVGSAVKVGPLGTGTALTSAANPPTLTSLRIGNWH